MLAHVAHVDLRTEVRGQPAERFAVGGVNEVPQRSQ
jgi:hypothetical protein